jgi:hypothetical protein
MELSACHNRAGGHIGGYTVYGKEKERRLKMNKAICIILVVFVSLSTSLVSADTSSIPGTPLYLEINGAKIVSEGGYFWFSITNKGDYWIEVALHYPPDFNMSRFNTSEPVHGMGESFGDGFYSFPLEPNDTWVIGFVAPTLPANLSYNSYLFTFYSAVGGISTNKAIDVSYYDVLVIKGVINVKVDDSKLNQLLSLYNELLCKLEALQNTYGDSKVFYETNQDSHFGIVSLVLLFAGIEFLVMELRLRKIEKRRIREHGDE